MATRCSFVKVKLRRIYSSAHRHTHTNIRKAHLYVCMRIFGWGRWAIQMGWYILIHHAVYMGAPVIIWARLSALCVYAMSASPAAAGCRATSLHSSYAYIACDAAHSRFMVCFCVILRLWRILCKGCFNGSTSWLLGLAAHHIFNTYTHAYSSIYTTHIYVYTLHMYTQRLMSDGHTTYHGL